MRRAIPRPVDWVRLVEPAGHRQSGHRAADEADAPKGVVVTGRHPHQTMPRKTRVP